MKNHQTFFKRTISLFALLMLVLVGTTGRAAASSSNRGVIPPNAHPYGSSYGEWSAKWWQWAFSLPRTSVQGDIHPLFSDEEVDCSYGQSGHVWFLGGTFTVVETGPNEVLGEVERRCSVPTGTALFFPVINAECSTIEGNGETEDALRECAEGFINHVDVTTVQATIDGKPVKDLAFYRQESPLFTFGPLPDNNLLQALGVSAATVGKSSDAVADGYYLMLHPLPPGEHTIHFSGSAVYTEAEDGFDFKFALDVTYTITVVPGR